MSDEEYLTQVVSEVAAKCQINQWRYSLRKFENIGQNYFGVIVPVTLSGIGEKGDVILPIVLKLAPTDVRYRVSGAVTLMFQREIYVYSVLLQKYRDYISCTRITPPFIIPDVYLVNNELYKEVIAMQDMSEYGYKPYTHETFLDFDHLTVALKSLAQLHALSYILREKSNQLYDEVIKICIPLTENSNKRYIDIMVDRLTKALSKFNNSSYVPLLEKLKLNCGDLFNKTIEMVKSTCICHGDVWKENILFQYDKTNKPISACLIDYQTARLSSPAFDVLYLIISSSNTNLRKQNYYSLLDIYYKMFSEVLRSHNLNPELIYHRYMLDHDLKVVAPACFITANTAMWLFNGLQEEGHVRSKHIWATSEEKETAVMKYKSIVKDIIDDFYSYGYFPSDIV